MLFSPTNGAVGANGGIALFSEVSNTYIMNTDYAELRINSRSKIECAAICVINENCKTTAFNIYASICVLNIFHGNVLYPMVLDLTDSYFGSKMYIIHDSSK